MKAKADKKKSSELPTTGNGTETVAAVVGKQEQQDVSAVKELVRALLQFENYETKMICNLCKFEKKYCLKIYAPPTSSSLVIRLLLFLLPWFFPS